MESRVRFALYKLIQAEVTHFDIQEVDEIVTSYVIGILEDLIDEKDPMEVFDVESFREMMQAYLPQSEIVKDENLTACVLKLVKDFKADKDCEKTPGLDISSLIADTTKTTQQPRKVVNVYDETEEDDRRKKKGGRVSESSECEVDGEIEAGLEILLEMFPSCYQIEAVHCLTAMRGDIERAVQLLITRAEMGQDIKPNQTQLLAKLSKPVEMDDSQVKKKIMEKYGFVDKEEDNRYHRPNISKKSEDKKLIRYREGKIVSTKGERFTQVTKEECLEMKRTIVNIQSV